MQRTARALPWNALRTAVGIGASTLLLAACAEKVVVRAPDPPKPAPVVVAPPPPMEPLKLPAPIKFATGTANLAPESDPTLRYVVEYMAARPELKQIRVEGHTDNVGNPMANQKLSEDRALSVAKWMIAHGVDCRRIVPLGYGDTKPVADNNSEEGRAQNRRTVFIDHRVRHEGGHHAPDPCH